jgi:hypothetical protein
VAVGRHGRVRAIRVFDTHLAFVVMIALNAGSASWLNDSAAH